MTESSRMPLFDLRKLNASLPVPKPMENSTKVLVLGAKDDFIVVRTKNAPSFVLSNQTIKFFNLGTCIKPKLVMVLQDDEGLKETGRFYEVEPVCIEYVAHDMMLDCSWEKGAEVLLSWLYYLSKPENLSA